MSGVMNIILIAFSAFALGLLSYLAYILINGALNNHNSHPTKEGGKPRTPRPSNTPKLNKTTKERRGQFASAR